LISISATDVIATPGRGEAQERSTPASWSPRAAAGKSQRRRITSGSAAFDRSRALLRRPPNPDPGEFFGFGLQSSLDPVQPRWLPALNPGARPGSIAVDLARHRSRVEAPGVERGSGDVAGERRSE
jgi:hypothetical protein